MLLGVSYHLQAKVYEIQLLKFGQRINLESLENVSVDRKTEELKQQLRAEESKWEAELKRWDQKLQVGMLLYACTTWHGASYAANDS